MATSLRKDVLESMRVDGGQVCFPLALEGSKFLAMGNPFLTQVPPNVTATPSAFTSKNAAKNTVGCFVGFDAGEPKSRHVVTDGELRDIRFKGIFRFKVWWTTHWIGNRGKDVENETQIDVAARHFGSPIIEGSFRAPLEAGEEDALDVCVESGSTKVTGSSFRSCLYIHAG